VAEVSYPACSVSIPIHNIEACRHHTVPRAGFAAVQDDMCKERIPKSGEALRIM